MNFIPDWEYETSNQSGIQIFQKTDVIAQTWELFREKNQFHWKIFSKHVEIQQKRENLQDKGSDTKFSDQMPPRIPFKVFFSLTNKSNLRVALHKIKGTIPR